MITSLLCVLRSGNSIQIKSSSDLALYSNKVLLYCQSLHEKIELFTWPGSPCPRWAFGHCIVFILARLQAYLLHGCSFCGKLTLQRFLQAKNLSTPPFALSCTHPWERKKLSYGRVWFKGIKDELKVVQREPCKSKREPTRCLGEYLPFT